MRIILTAILEERETPDTASDVSDLTDISDAASDLSDLPLADYGEPYFEHFTFDGQLEPTTTTTIVNGVQIVTSQSWQAHEDEHPRQLATGSTEEQQAIDSPQWSRAAMERGGNVGRGGEHRSWRCVDDDEAAESLVAAFAKDKGEGRSR